MKKTKKYFYSDLVRKNILGPDKKSKPPPEYKMDRALCE